MKVLQAFLNDVAKAFWYYRYVAVAFSEGRNFQGFCHSDPAICPLQSMKVILMDIFTLDKLFLDREKWFH